MVFPASGSDVPAAGVVADRVALLGDAVHPMPAYLAQGACQAIDRKSVV